MEVEAGLGCECALCDRGLMSLQSHQLSLAEEEVKQKSGLGLVVCGVRSPAVLAPLLGSEHVKVLPPQLAFASVVPSSPAGTTSPTDSPGQLLFITQVSAQLPPPQWDLP